MVILISNCIKPGSTFYNYPKDRRKLSIKIINFIMIENWVNVKILKSKENKDRIRCF